MTDNLCIKLDRDSLTKLLRSNISVYLGREITVELMDLITKQAVESMESIRFFERLNEKFSSNIEKD